MLSKLKSQELWISTSFHVNSLIISKDPTNFEENLWRKKLKIKTIKKETFIPDSQNILNTNQRTDTALYKAILRDHNMFHYPKVEYYLVSKNGVIYSYKKKPISDYLTPEDLIYCNNIEFKRKKSGRKEKVDYYVSGELKAKYRYKKSLLINEIKEKDTIVYFYDENSNLKKITKNKKTTYCSNYTKKEVEHCFFYYDSINMIEKEYKLKVKLNDDNQMISSCINEKNNSDLKLYHKIIRDIQGNVIKILQDSSLEFKNTGEIVSLENEYNEGNLTIITEYINEKTNWIKYYFQNGYLRKKQYSWGIVINYNYTFY